MVDGKGKRGGGGLREGRDMVVVYGFTKENGMLMIMRSVYYFYREEESVVVYQT